METINIKEQIELSATFKEIQQQSRMWNETIGCFENELEQIQKYMKDVIDDGRLDIIVTGAGSSEFVGQSVAAYLSQKYGLNVKAIPTTDIVTNPKFYFRQNHRTLLISCARSGNSPESIAAVNQADECCDDIHHVIVTCNEEGTLALSAEEADNKLLILLPKETNDVGFAMTSSFTSMVLSVLLLFAQDNLACAKKVMHRVGMANAEIIVRYFDELIKISESLGDRMVFLGSNALKGLAQESALKMLELVNGKIVTSFDSFLGFRHGPKSVVKDGTVIVAYLSKNDYTRRYELDLIREIAKDDTNSQLLVFSYGYNDEAKELADNYFCLEPFVDNCMEDIFLMFNYLTFTQLMAVQKSIQFGLNPDNPCPSGEVNRVVQGVDIY